MEYRRSKTEATGAETLTAVFAPAGKTREAHVIVTPDAGSDFERQCADAADAFRKAADAVGFAAAHAVFIRLFLFDANAQIPMLSKVGLLKSLVGNAPVAVSIVGQTPLPEMKIALYAHLVDAQPCARNPSANGVAMTRGGLTHLWTTGLAAGVARKGGAENQTVEILENYVSILASHGARLADHAVRTWIYVRDIDSNYGGMVKARAAFFAGQRMNRDTHYVASTGIEGGHADPAAVVMMDAYAVAGLRPEQVRFLHAEDHLGPTHLYGVTFERGTRIDYGDRSHVFLSGTASIDPAGRTLHVGDAERQTERTLDNIHALLADAGAAESDMTHLLVYLRAPRDREVVMRRVQAAYPDVPKICLHAPVCRPEWLVEIEGQAVVAGRRGEFDDF